MKNLNLTISLIVTSYLITSCVTKTLPEGESSDRVTVASPNQLFSVNFENFKDDRRLLSLLDPKYCGNIQEYNTSNIKTCSEEKLSDFQLQQKIRIAFMHANNEYRRRHRTQIQDRIIAASNQGCNLYKVYLKRMSTQQNSTFGVLTTILAGAGTIATQANAARTFAGLAGISSGSRAELNKAVFESLTTSIVIPGINSKREELLQKMKLKDSNSLEEYTVEHAIADAITYHGACSIDSGINHAAKTIQNVENLKESHNLGSEVSSSLLQQLGVSSKVNSGISYNHVHKLSKNRALLSLLQSKVNRTKNIAKGLSLEAKNEYDNIIRKLKDLESKTTPSADILHRYYNNYIDTKGKEKKIAKLQLEVKIEEARAFQYKFRKLKKEFKKLKQRTE